MSALRRVLHVSLLILAVIGIASAVFRALFPSDAIARLEQTRERYAGIPAGIPDPALRAALAVEWDGTFAAHPGTARLHVIPGALFLALAPLQLSSRFRRRFVPAHRWIGRTLLVLGAAAAATGLFFGLVRPFGGAAESVAIVIFDAWFVLALARGYAAVRAGDIVRHREWMLRSLGVAFGISMVRVFGAALDLTLTPAGYSVKEIFVMSIWAGFVTTTAAAEIWIRVTRQRSRGYLINPTWVPSDE